jgi:S-(hydroxymethyl)glutathione dehydrogenase/alcohol dehydrogenase
LALVELEIPPLKPGQVLVEVAYSGACGTQVMEVHGYKGEDKWLPHCLGHEGTGMVLDVGSAVLKVKPGDKVVLSWIKGGGIEAGGTVYSWDGKQVNAGAVTTFQRHAVVSENRLTVLPDGLSMDVAVLLGCAAPTGMGAVFNVTQVKAGESVAVFGTGGIGLSACLGAAFSGAMPIIGIDPNKGRRALAMMYGATQMIDPTGVDIIAEIKKFVPGGVDVAIEATGIPEVMSQAVDATRMQGGRAVVIGNARVGQKLSIDPTIFNHGKSLMGTWGGNSVPDRDYLRFARLLGSGRFPVHALFSKPYGLHEVNSAVRDLEAGRVGRPLIDLSLR